MARPLLLLSLAVSMSLVATAAWLLPPSGATGVANKSEQPQQLRKPPTVPEVHQQMMRKLRQPRLLNFKDASQQECLRDLSKSLGVRLELDPQLADLASEMVCTVKTKDMVSHLTALRMCLQTMTVHNTVLVFEDDRILIKPYNDERPALRTSDLSMRSDFSRSTRLRLITEVVNRVHWESWIEGTWIQPGEAIFEVDMYQTLKVHDAAQRHLFPNHYNIPTDADVLKLTNHDFLKPKKTISSEEQEAIVKRLRKRYPYESISDRLKYEATADQQSSPRLSEAAAQRIDDQEKQFDQLKQQKWLWRSMRAESLRMLHEEEVATFVGKPGFGLRRMEPPGPTYLPYAQPAEMPLAENDTATSSDELPIALPATELQAEVRRIYLPSEATMNSVHFANQGAFLPVTSFGFVKSKNQVAGFNAHSIRQMHRIHSFRRKPWYTKPKEAWVIHRLELVSLLKHKKPRVYVSRNLPSMDELTESETRPLNRFETSSLSDLYAGEDVVTSGSLNRLQMFGSLRATKQCLECHDVERGALLGAFSYAFLRDPKLDPNKHQTQSRGAF